MHSMGNIQKATSNKKLFLKRGKIKGNNNIEVVHLRRVMFLNHS